MEGEKKCQKLILFEQGVEQNILYVHHLLAVDSASGHDAMMHGVCMCEAKADNITASHGLLRQTGNGITSDYWLAERVRPHTHSR